MKLMSLWKETTMLAQNKMMLLMLIKILKSFYSQDQTSSMKTLHKNKKIQILWPDKLLKKFGLELNRKQNLIKVLKMNGFLISLWLRQKQFTNFYGETKSYTMLIWAIVIWLRLCALELLLVWSARSRWWVST
jgi:hypothetical protein